MPHWGYSARLVGQENAVKASAREVDISPKWAREVCRAIQGLTIGEARRLLEDVAEMKRMVPYRRYNRKRAHHAASKGPGGFPTRVARLVLKLLDSLEANADFKGLDTDKTRIASAVAHKGRVLPRYIERAHGRSSPYNKTLVHIELVAVGG